MTISEFAKSRDIQTNTVSKYIRDHAKEFEGHTSKGDKDERTVVLDEVALELLDKKYPIPKPVMVINGIPEEEHLKALAGKDAEIQSLQKAMMELQERHTKAIEQIGELSGKALLLEDRERQVQDQKQEIEKLSGELDRIRNASLWDRIRKKF